MLFDAVLPSAIGKLGIEIENENLTGIHFLSAETKIAQPRSSLGREVSSQLAAFFEKKLTTFDLPLSFPASKFAQKALRFLACIPYGQTLTYGEVARAIETSPRAVGNACRRNPFPIVIPCHRVVSQTGLGGYCGVVSGPLLDVKALLLNHERS